MWMAWVTALAQPVWTVPVGDLVEPGVLGTSPLVVRTADGPVEVSRSTKGAQAPALEWWRDLPADGRVLFGRTTVGRWVGHQLEVFGHEGLRASVAAEDVQVLGDAWFVRQGSDVLRVGTDERLTIDGSLGTWDDRLVVKQEHGVVVLTPDLVPVDVLDAPYAGPSSRFGSCWVTLPTRPGWPIRCVGAAGWTADARGAVYDHPPVLGDVTGDGRPELVVLGRGGAVRAFDEDGRVVGERQVPAGALGPPAAYDVDRDGRDELVVVYPGSVEAWTLDPPAPGPEWGTPLRPHPSSDPGMEACRALEGAACAETADRLSTVAARHAFREQACVLGWIPACEQLADDDGLEVQRRQAAAERVCRADVQRCSTWLQLLPLPRQAGARRLVCSLGGPCPAPEPPVPPLVFEAHGRLFVDGRPSAGARIAFGDTVVVTDAKGRFAVRTSPLEAQILHPRVRQPGFAVTDAPMDIRVQRRPHHAVLLEGDAPPMAEVCGAQVPVRGGWLHVLDGCAVEARSARHVWRLGEVVEDTRVAPEDRPDERSSFRIRGPDGAYGRTPGLELVDGRRVGETCPGWLATGEDWRPTCRVAGFPVAVDDGVQVVGPVLAEEPGRVWLTRGPHVLVDVAGGGRREVVVDGPDRVFVDGPSDGVELVFEQDGEPASLREVRAVYRGRTFGIGTTDVFGRLTVPALEPWWTTFRVGDRTGDWPAYGRVELRQPGPEDIVWGRSPGGLVVLEADPTRVDVHPGDVLVAVDGMDIRALSQPEIEALLRGRTATVHRAGRAVSVRF